MRNFFKNLIKSFTIPDFAVMAVLCLMVLWKAPFLGIAAVEVLQGQYVARNDNNLGVAKGPVHVWNGASLTVAGGNKVVYNRTVTVSGAGMGGQNPAVRFSGSAVWDKTDHAL